MTRSSAPSSVQVADSLLFNRGNTEAVVPKPDDQLLLTKGDNNPVDDIGLYRGLKHLQRKHVVGKVRGYVFTFGVHGMVHPLARNA